ncbi:PAS domain-containing protein [Flavobacterium sp. XS2P39]|uniref:PAS domain-containing protein n=1 Tax=Flavobacterium sp. XS2P39 TaxID=3401725 RepID=UPI003AADC66F
MKRAKLTYNDLLDKVKDQELENEQSINNFDFYQIESQDFVCIVGTDGFLKKMNPSFIKVLGYTEEELFDNSIIAFIHPDDIEKSNKETEQLSSEQTSRTFENRYVKKNKEIVAIQWTFTVSASGEFIYAIGRNINQINGKSKTEIYLK